MVPDEIVNGQELPTAEEASERASSDAVERCNALIATAFPGSGGEYDRGFCDAMESMTLALGAEKIQPSAVISAVVTVLDAYGNNVDDDDDAPTM